MALRSFLSNRLRGYCAVRKAFKVRTGESVTGAIQGSSTAGTALLFFQLAAGELHSATLRWQTSGVPDCMSTLGTYM